MIETFEITEDMLPDFANGVIELCSTIEKDTAVIVLLEGDLGAGKTTFTKVFAENLGVTDRVHSPTFVLKKEYSTPHHKIKKIVHIDAYRFTHPKEAKVLQLEKDLQDKNTVVLIEWPSKMNVLKSDIKISLEVIDELKRKVTVEYETQENGK